MFLLTLTILALALLKTRADLVTLAVALTHTVTRTVAAIAMSILILNSLISFVASTFATIATIDFLFGFLLLLFLLRDRTKTDGMNQVYKQTAAVLPHQEQVVIET